MTKRWQLYFMWLFGWVGGYLIACRDGRYWWLGVIIGNVGYLFMIYKYGYKKGDE